MNKQDALDIFTQDNKNFWKKMMNENVTIFTLYFKLFLNQKD